jgi:hypothetical protein
MGAVKTATEFPVDIIAIVRDITQRKWVQKALRKSIRGAGDARPGAAFLKRAFIPAHIYPCFEKAPH